MNRPILDLQQKAGNRATVATLASGGGRGGGRGSTSAPRRKRTDAELLTGPLPPVGDPDYQRAVRLRISRGHQRRADEQYASSGLLGWLGSFLPGSVSYQSAEDEEDEDEGGEVGEVAYDEHELASHDSEEDEEDEEGGGEHEEGGEDAGGAAALLAPLAPSQLFIVLDKASAKAKGTAVGDVSASATTKLTGEGVVEHSAKVKAEGSKGKGEGEGSLKTGGSNVEGKGKVEFVLGATSDHKTGTLGWDVAGAALEGSGELSGFAGAKAAAEASARYDLSTGDLAAAAKAGALVGIGTEGTVKVKLKAGDVDYGEAEGKLGVHFGLGGEVSGTVSWKGGVLDFSTAGKYAFGPGVSYSYKVTVNTNNLVKSGSSFLSSLWSWMTTLPEGVTEEDLWV